ncbi:uncharacterized protein BO96DRAFT_415324, partial [Aspergillus niger CBS 101883]|uniref:uncharacterized protein n=1 Tax=Aspergillus lacticoffeatus (strain CBS 101883) TaxID=1450533 RepID=UPI000D803C3E
MRLILLRTPPSFWSPSALGLNTPSAIFGRETHTERETIKSRRFKQEEKFCTRSDSGFRVWNAWVFDQGSARS